MVIGSAPSGSVVPASGPVVTASVRAADRFFGAAGAGREDPRAARAAGAAGGAGRGEVRAARLAEKSDLMATTAASTSPHMSTRTMARSRNSSAGIGGGSVLAVLVDENGGAQLDPVARSKLPSRRRHFVDPDAVGRAGVDEHNGLAFQAQLCVPPGDAGVVEPQVGVDTPTDNGHR